MHCNIIELVKEGRGRGRYLFGHGDVLIKGFREFFNERTQIGKEARGSLPFDSHQIPKALALERRYCFFIESLLDHFLKKEIRGGRVLGRGGISYPDALICFEYT